MEIWKPIEGFEGLYSVSNLGRVKSLERKVDKSGYDKNVSSKILKSSIDVCGYYHLVIHKNGKPKTFRIHRLIAIHFIPNPGNKKQINHINGDKLDNRLENLEWCTSKENTQHAFKNGLGNNGEKHYKSQLTETQVLEIRNLAKNGVSRKVLVSLFGIGKESVRDIINRKNWKHI